MLSLDMKWWKALPSLVLISACSLDPPDASGSGELGVGTFHYRCAGKNDAICVDPAAAGEFPRCLALGSSFQLSFEQVLGEFKDARAATASPSRITGGESHFKALTEGPATIVAVSEDRIVDMRHFVIEPPTQIGLIRDGDSLPEPLVIGAGQDIEFDVYAKGACSPLGGSLALQATSSDEAVVRLRGSGSVIVTGVTTGEAQVRIRLGEIERAITVVVQGEAGTTTGSVDSSTTASDTSTGHESTHSTSDTGDTDASTSDDTTGDPDATTGGDSTGDPQDESSTTGGDR